MIARLSIRALSFNADRRFFARRDRAKTSRGDAEVSRPPRSSRRVSDAPLTRHPSHTIQQISDGVLDACLAQDPDSKVRLRPRRRSPIESAKTTRDASETFFATRATRAVTRVDERARPRFHPLRKRPRQPGAHAAATRRGRLAEGSTGSVERRTRRANAAGGGHVGRRAAGTAAEARNTVSLFIFFPNRALSGTPRGG